MQRACDPRNERGGCGTPCLLSNFSSAWIDAPLRSSRLSFERRAAATKSAVCSGTTFPILRRKHRAIVAHLSLTPKKTEVLVVVASFQVLCGSRAQLHRHDTFSAAKNKVESAVQTIREAQKTEGRATAREMGPQDKENERPSTVNVEPSKVEFFAFFFLQKNQREASLSGALRKSTWKF